MVGLLVDRTGFTLEIGCYGGKEASHFRWHGDAFTNAQLIDAITPKSRTLTLQENRAQEVVSGVGQLERRQLAASGR